MRIRCYMLSLMAALITSQAQASNAIKSFAIESVRGDEIKMMDYADQWVVINFWATWCKPCRKELPDLQALHDSRNDTTVIGLAFEDQPVQAVIEFLDEFNVSYPVAIVDVFEPPELFGYPEVMPTSVLISPEGEIAKTWYGEKDKNGTLTVALIDQFIQSAEAAE